MGDLQSEREREIVAAREQERRRIARRWLDGPAQTLANLALHAEVCMRLLDREPNAARQELEHLRAGLGEALQATRLFLYDVQPPGVGDVDFVSTLRRYLGLLAEGYRVATELTTNGEALPLGSSLAINLFRSVQEPLELAATRTGTARVTVRFEWHPGGLALTIEDDGRTVIRRTPGPDRSTDVMRDAQVRLALIGGRIVVEPPGLTNRVRIEVPLPLA